MSRGSVLMSVIWTLLVLGIFLLAVTRQASSELFFGQWMHQQVVMRTLAQAGFERALFELQNDKFYIFDAPQENWGSNEKAFKDIAYGEGRYAVVCGETGKTVYGACDEASRLNLNSATEPMLQKLLVAVCGLNKQQAIAMARAIVDWRDPDDAVTGEEGAESGYYRALPSPYQPRNGPFEAVEELGMVRDVTAEMLGRLRPYLTVYTDGKINFNTAQPKVLEALGISPETALKIQEFRAGADGIPGTLDDEVLQSPDSITAAISAKIPLGPEEVAEISNAVSANLAAVRSDVFRIHSFGRLMKGAELLESQVTAVVKRDGTILYWKEGADEAI